MRRGDRATSDDFEKTKERQRSEREVPTKSKLLLPPRVSNHEVYFYIFIFICLTIYLTYTFYVACFEYRKEVAFPSDYFADGWEIIGRKKDVAHGAFEADKSIFIKYLMYWPLAYVILARLVDNFFWQSRQWFLLIFGLFFVYKMLGTWALCILLCQSLIMFAVLKITRRKTLIWAAHLFLVATMYFKPFTTWRSTYFYGHDLFVEVFLLQLMFKQNCFRCVAFCLENVTNPQPSLINMWTYLFYFPLSIYGPLINYDTFSKQLRSPKLEWTLGRTVRCCMRIVRMIFWMFFMDFILHYLYIYAVHTDTQFLENSSMWTLVGSNSWQGLFYHMWHLVQFGLSSSIAALDQIETERMPRCVGTVCYYGDMYRKFDRGVYSFIKRYIYQFSGGNRHGFPWQLFLSLVCFVYVGFVQGGTLLLMVWGVANFLEGVLEAVVSRTYRSVTCQVYLRSRLSEANVRRLQGLLTVPLHFSSLVLIHFYFDDAEVTWIYAKRFYLHGQPLYYLATLFFMYFYTQICLEADIWEAYAEGKITSVWYRNLDDVDVRVQEKERETKLLAGKIHSQEEKKLTK